MESNTNTETKRKDAVFRCEEENCSFEAKMCHLLSEHLKQEHNICMNEQTLDFKNLEEFGKWKEQEESDSCSRYIRTSGIKVWKNKRTNYYGCNRSGFYEAPEDRKRTMKAQGSVKINRKCTASMKVVEDVETKCVSVLYRATHYGHEKSVEHVPILKKTRLEIAEKLRAGMTSSRVLQDCRASSNTFAGECESASMCNRNMLIVKKDLCNIKRQFAISGVVRHEDDHISVSMWVEELHKQGNKDIAFYKPRGLLAEEFSSLGKDDFILVIQTQFQQQQYEAFGKDFIYLDSTHSSTQLTIRLITVLCVDEWGEGVPVLWMLTNTEDIATIHCLFSLLKNKCPNISPEYLMSDDEPVYYSAFKQVYPEASTQKILSTWHVLKTWRTAITEMIGVPKEIQDDIYADLRLIVNSNQLEDFENLLGLFMSKLLEHEESTNFAHYFMSTFANRSEEWGMWARNISLVNTYKYAEAFHKFLRHGDSVEGKRNQRLDFLIDVLFKVEAHHLEEKGKMKNGKLTKRIKKINARHIESEEMLGDECMYEKVNDYSWRFTDKNYLVTKQSCPRSLCRLECAMCQICIHAYSCSCSDMAYTKTICKHVHFIHQRNIEFQDSQVDESILSQEQLTMEDQDYLALHYLDSSVKNDNTANLLEQLKTSTDSKRQASIEHCVVLSDVLQKMDKVIALACSCEDSKTLQEIIQRLDVFILPAFDKRQ